LINYYGSKIQEPYKNPSNTDSLRTQLKITRRMGQFPKGVGEKKK